MYTDENKDLEYGSVLKRHFMKGVESARMRFAKELHDRVGNEIYVLVMSLKSGNINMEDTIAYVEKLYRRIRDISHRLYAPPFQTASLVEVLEQYIDDRNNSQPIRFFIDIEEKDDFVNLSSDISLLVYRIIQESTQNILKHSKAHNAHFVLHIFDEKLCIKVTDDGIGFDPLRKSRGIGLYLMKEGIESVKGSFCLHTKLGEGCTINITLPIA